MLVRPLPLLNFFVFLVMLSIAKFCATAPCSRGRFWQIVTLYPVLGSSW
jgi:hypothetical protein